MSKYPDSVNQTTKVLFNGHIENSATKLGSIYNPRIHGEFYEIDTYQAYKFKNYF